MASPLLKRWLWGQRAEQRDASTALGRAEPATGDSKRPALKPNPARPSAPAALSAGIVMRPPPDPKGSLANPPEPTRKLDRADLATAHLSTNGEETLDPSKFHRQGLLSPVSSDPSSEDEDAPLLLTERVPDDPKPDSALDANDPARESAVDPAQDPRAEGQMFGDAKRRAARLAKEETAAGEDALPSFRFLASDMSMASANRIGSVRAQALQVLREAFTPTQPKQSVRLFAGRRRELKRIISAIEEWKAHVVIFGERGYGKSSLANVVVEIARQGGITVLTCSCASEITFEEMFRGFLREIPLPYRGIPGRGEGSFARQGNFASLLPEGSFGAMELTDALRHLTDRHVIFRIDEFDRVRDGELRNQLAEAIKNLSDAGARITFLIVGVAEDLDQLLGKHPSIQRNVVGIHLSLMSEGELLQLIAAGEKAANITFDDDVRRRIVALAQGLPYLAQLLALHCGQIAVDDGSRHVRAEHLVRAIDQVVALTPPALERNYERAFRGRDHEQAKIAAFTAALSPCDPWGYFSGQELARGQRIKEARNLSTDRLLAFVESLADDTAGAPLFKLREDRGSRYFAFADPLMRPYVLFRMGRELGVL